MRQITRDAVNAFMSGKDFKRGNTEVKNGVMYLHGNAIATKNNVGYMSPDAIGIMVNLAGWNTRTTRERLNGLISPKYRIFQKDFTPYLESRNGLAMFEMGSRRWYRL